ncbi:GDSL-type esterase/lipase family protein [Sinomicrobium oceani]|uniref:GDSL-type esterase/lipase family protein n=1 Tax=Sinomicrobium oceani TaxID=1150368 RepID=UPI00227C30A8|nr:GDSL-type esterase/lipase family protein [Sinomicrobium oceani]
MKTKKILAISCLVWSLGTGWCTAQEIDSTYANSYYQQRMRLFATLPESKGGIVFLGNSITERGHWNELLPGKRIKNRGIGGDNTFGMLARLSDITAQKPAKLFFLGGINDMARNLPVTVVIGNYKRIIEQIRKESPKTRIYIQSVLPINEALLTAPYFKGKSHLIPELNKGLRQLALIYKIPYIDLYHDLFTDEEGALKGAWTPDGVHLHPEAYVAWVDYLKKQGAL